MKNLKQKLIYNAKNIVRRKLRLLVKGVPPYRPMTIEIEATKAHTDKQTQQRHSKSHTHDHNTERKNISKNEIEKTSTEKDMSLEKSPSSNQNTVASTDITSPGTSTEKSTSYNLASTGSHSTHGKTNLTDDHTGTVEIAEIQTGINSET